MELQGRDRRKHYSLAGPAVGKDFYYYYYYNFSALDITRVKVATYLSLKRP
jgi:hypothetical protein